MDVTPNAFKAIQALDVEAIGELSADEIRPLLPCLVRLALCPSADNSQGWADKRKTILQIISQNEEVNAIISLLSVDFNAMEVELKKELEQKTGLSASLKDISKPGLNDNQVISSIVNNLSLDFERSDGFCRLRLIISELFAIQVYATELRSKQTTDCLCNSELFDHDVYINELSDVLCIALAELPTTLQLLQIVETLLYVRSGPRLIQRIAANFSEHFEDICLGLLEHGEAHEHEESLLGSVRTGVLRALCRMNPPFAFRLRAAAIHLSRLPALCIHLTLDHMQLFAGRENNQDARYVSDLVDFVRGILLGEQGRAAAGGSNINSLSSGVCASLFPADALAPWDGTDMHEPVRGELHEPVYTLVYQVYDRLDRLLGSLDDRQRDGNKELLLLFANVFTLFNATIGEKIKLQHELDDQRDRGSQLSYRLTKEKEHGTRLREKLEEYEAQTQEELSKYESEIETLECRINRMDKERRRQQFEQEDTHRELKHLLDGMGRLFELLQEYGGSECGATLFFQLYRPLFEQCEPVEARDRLKMLSQLNALLERRLVDVKHNELRLQEQKILSKIRANEQKINKIFESGGAALRPLDERRLCSMSMETDEVEQEGRCTCSQQDQGGCGEVHCIHAYDSMSNGFMMGTSTYAIDAKPFALEDTIDGQSKNTEEENSSRLGYSALDRAELAERLRQLKELNQTNLSRLLQMEKSVRKDVGLISNESNRNSQSLGLDEDDDDTDVDESLGDEEESLAEEEPHDELDQLSIAIFDDFLHEFIQCTAQQQFEEAKCRLAEMLSKGLVQVNHNNEIIATSTPDAKLSQAKLMLIDDQLNQSVVDEAGDDFHEDIHHRFEQSFTEIIRASVSSVEQSPAQGETLKSILDRNEGEDSLEWNSIEDSAQKPSNEKLNASLLETDKCNALKCLTECKVAQSRQELDEIDGQINDILCDIGKLGTLGSKFEGDKPTPLRTNQRDYGTSTIGLIVRHDASTGTEGAKRDNFTWPMKIAQRHTSTNTITKFHRNAFTLTDPIPIKQVKSNENGFAPKPKKSNVAVQTEAPNNVIEATSIVNKQVPLTEVCWRIPSINFLLTIICYVFCFIKHLAMGVIFLFCSFVFLTQLLFSTTRMPLFHSWEEIVVKLLDPYVTKEHVF